MMVLVERKSGGSRNSVNHPRMEIEDPLPVVESYTNSEIFYKDSPKFLSGRHSIMFMPVSKCKQCKHYKKHCSQSGYCYIRKRIVDANESCEENTRTSYQNVNMRKTP